jgi:hypothetical protein
MKSTFTFAIDTKVLDNFFTNCEEKGFVKSAILQQLVIEYLENGLRDDPSTTRSKTTPRQSNEGIVK